MYYTEKLSGIKSLIWAGLQSLCFSKITHLEKFYICRLDSIKLSLRETQIILRRVNEQNTYKEKNNIRKD